MAPSLTASHGTMIADSKGIVETVGAWRSDKLPVTGGNQAQDAKSLLLGGDQGEVLFFFFF